MKEKTDSLIQDSMKLGEIMYKEAQENAEKEKAEKEKKSTKGKTNEKPKDKKSSKVVDADFEDVTEKKKDGTDKEKSG